MRFNWIDEMIAEGKKPVFRYKWNTPWGDVEIEGLSVLNASARARDRREITAEQYEYVRENEPLSTAPTGRVDYGV